MAVCPFDEGLLQRLRGRKVVIEAGSIAEAASAIEFVQSMGIGDLHCLSIRTPVPLADVPVTEEWKGVPIALHCPTLGRFPEVMRKLLLLHECNIRVYLPAASRKALTALRILSSLGVEVAVDFNGGPVRWEELSDLMTYSLLGLAQHSPIEPFHYVAKHYNANNRTDFGSVYFNDAARFIYVDVGGRVALSREDREAERFIAPMIDEKVDLNEVPEYLEHLEGWRAPFLKSEGCAFCLGWRVCLGKFPDGNGQGGCRPFFTELMDVVEQHQSLEAKKKETWQP